MFPPFPNGPQQCAESQIHPIGGDGDSAGDIGQEARADDEQGHAGAGDEAEEKARREQEDGGEGFEKAHPRRSSGTGFAVALEAFLEAFVTASFDAAAASAYGPVRQRLSAGGTPIGPLDTLIAAHALALEAVLVTRNVREFRRVGGLRVENWLAP